ncbi:MAG: hypothetical protein GTO03_13720 [Planctomycetales bacterium]|nr:hypothetical protein [Planctomycetales bacterium]
MIETRCEGCGTIVAISDQHVGRRARCPRCGTEYTVPPSSDLTALDAVCHFCGAALVGGPAEGAEEFKTCAACRESILENQAEIESQHFTSAESWRMVRRCGGFLLGLVALYLLVRLFLGEGRGW